MPEDRAQTAEDRIAEVAEEYFRELERDGYRPEGCNGDYFAKDLIQALGLTEETRSSTDPREVWYGAPIEAQRRFVTPWEQA